MMDAIESRARKASKVTWIGSFANLILVLFKLAAGVFGHSAAMLADGIHSLSDFATDIVILVCFRITGKPADACHDYGHGKFETLAATIVGMVLLAAGAGIFWSGAQSIWAALGEGVNPGKPGEIALIAALVSVAVKEWLYRYTMRAAQEINSQAVIANAWHHRSDALSSIGTALGIGGAILLGENWRILDPIAAVVVSVFILKAATTILAGGVRDLMEESLGETVKQEIIAMTKDIQGVIEPHGLRTRRIGNTVSVDLHIYVDGGLNVVDGHSVASRVEGTIRKKFGLDSFVSVHVDPYPNKEGGSRARRETL